MVSQKITVKNMTGFHLRPAGILCKIAMNYKSKVQFQFNSVTANAKSVLSVLGAGVKNGDEIEEISSNYSSSNNGMFTCSLRRKKQHSGK